MVAQVVAQEACKMKCLTLPDTPVITGTSRKCSAITVWTMRASSKPPGSCWHEPLHPGGGPVHPGNQGTAL